MEMITYLKTDKTMQLGIRILQSTTRYTINGSNK